MRSAISRRKLLLITSITTVGIVFIFFDFGDDYERSEQPKSNLKKPQSFIERILNPVDMGFEAAVFDTNTWVFNKNIMQYSTMAGINSQNEVEIQAIILSKTPFLNNLKCLVSSNNVQFINTSVRNILKMNDKFWQIYQIKCVFKADMLSNISNMFVSVIDARDYEITDNTNKTKIFAQRPTFYDLNTKKVPGVTNCVHMLRDVGSNRYKKILNWVEINKAIGLSKTTFYHVDHNKTYMDIIRKKYPDFVHVIDYEYDLARVCSKLEAHGLTDCSKTYGIIFEESRFNLHERICTNECKL
jgi:hypothetical protein